MHVFVLHVFLTLLSCLFFSFDLFSVSTIMKLNERNYKQWVEYFMMNLTIMKLNLVLKVKASPKPNVESFTNEKKFYEDWEHSNCSTPFRSNPIGGFEPVSGMLV